MNWRRIGGGIGGDEVNDTNATQTQVVEELKNLVEGITPLAFVTLAVLAGMVWQEVTSDKGT